MIQRTDSKRCPICHTKLILLLTSYVCNNPYCDLDGGWDEDTEEITLDMRPKK